MKKTTTNIIMPSNGLKRFKNQFNLGVDILISSGFKIEPSRIDDTNFHTESKKK